MREGVMRSMETFDSIARQFGLNRFETKEDQFFGGERRKEALQKSRQRGQRRSNGRPG